LLPEIKDVATRSNKKHTGRENYAVRMANTLCDELTGKKERLVYPEEKK
jgi:hypothetical protein